MISEVGQTHDTTKNRLQFAVTVQQEPITSCLQ